MTGPIPGDDAIRVRIYFGERDHHGHNALWSAMLQFLRREGCAGATVTRGVAGFGAHSVIHAASIVDLSTDLPMVLEWIDTEPMVNRLLPQLGSMLDGGMITTEPVTIVAYRTHDGARD